MLSSDWSVNLMNGLPDHARVSELLVVEAKTLPLIPREQRTLDDDDDDDDVDDTCDMVSSVQT